MKTFNNTMIQRIKDAVLVNENARRVFEELVEILEVHDAEPGLCGRRQDTAYHIIAAMKHSRSNCRHSPPWEPPRYRLPEERLSLTRKLVINDADSGRVKYYANLGFYENGDLAELFFREVGESSTVGALLDSLATAISIGLQHGVPWSAYAAKMMHLSFPPNGWTDDDDVDLKRVSSVLDYVARWTTKARKHWRNK